MRGVWDSSCELTENHHCLAKHPVYGFLTKNKKLHRDLCSCIRVTVNIREDKVCIHVSSLLALCQLTQHCLTGRACLVGFLFAYHSAARLQPHLFSVCFTQESLPVKRSWHFWFSTKISLLTDQTSLDFLTSFPSQLTYHSVSVPHFSFCWK